MQRAWITEAVDRHQRPLLAYVYRLTGDAERSRDVVQDAFVQLCQQPDGFTDRLAAWLYSVCRNRAIDLARKETRMTALMDAGTAVPTRERPPAESAEVQDSAADLMTRLKQLPALQQEAVRLKFHEQFSYKEIAAITGTSVSHVGVLLHEALTTLRSQMT